MRYKVHKGDTLDRIARVYGVKPARIELEEAWKRGFPRDLTTLAADRWYAHARTRALAEATLFVGLRKAGMPDG